MPPRLRVLFVIGNLGGGGAERQVVEILKHLDRSRFEPLLYLATRQGELLSEVPQDVPVFAFWDGTAETWSRRWMRRLKVTRLARYLHLARLLRREKINLIYDRTYLATLDAAGGCWFRPTPRISCCVADPESELKLRTRRSTTLAWWFARRAYLSASRILANSQGLNQRVVDYFRLSDHHVQTFYNLIDFARIERLSSDDVPGLWHEPFLIVTSGRMDPLKGQQYLLEAVRELVYERKRAVHLVILGQGELELRFRQFVTDHKLERHVTLAGFVPNPFPWYKHAKLFVLSSLYEGLPNALIEAIACCTPVLSTDCHSGPSEILDQGRIGHLVAPGDSRALADAIASCMDHYAEWQLLTGPALAYARSLFDLPVGIRRLEEILLDVASPETSSLSERIPVSTGK